MVSLLPGPVEIADEIRAVYAMPPISHRSIEFIACFERVRQRLRELTGSAQVALMCGTGTLANDAVAAQLEGPGLVLSNGEFGERLVRQAKSSGLEPRVQASSWGEPWNWTAIEAALPAARWVWAVHLETSTGMVNNIARLGDIAARSGTRVCLDCVSSLGAIDLDLSRVWLASSVSGKALGSYAGIAIIFSSAEALQPRRVPPYLDAWLAVQEDGPRFTFPSPPLLALDRALEMERDYRPLGDLVRRRLRNLGWTPLVDEPRAAPVITTFRTPEPGFTERCRALGYHISGESGYLRERGWVQIATMGAVRQAHIETLFERLACSRSLSAGC